MFSLLLLLLLLLLLFIYNTASVNISLPHLGSSTGDIRVGRGVLQGDPCSPLLFNVCFDSFLKVVASEQYKQLGFAWGSQASPRFTSCLQFADDSCLIGHNCESAQSLVNIAAAWSKYAQLPIRIDKCATFG